MTDWRLPTHTCCDRSDGKATIARARLAFAPVVDDSRFLEQLNLALVVAVDVIKQVGKFATHLDKSRLLPFAEYC